MAQFDVHQNPNAAQPNQPAFFIILQSDFVDYLATRLVAPLYSLGALGSLPAKLAPVVTLGDRDYLVAMPQMAGIPKSRLGAKVTSLGHQRDVFIAAMDFLIVGF